MKKFACLLLSLIISVGLFCACSPTYDGTFIKHDYERDYSQVIVKIDPITQSGDGWEYTSEPIEIYKSQLVSYFNTYGPTYIQSMGWTYERTLETLLEQIITQELVVLESDVRFEAKDIYWTKDDIETVQKGVYKSIDSSILSLCNEILEAAGKDKLELTAESTDSDTETTYPVRDEKTKRTTRGFFTLTARATSMTVGICPSLGITRAKSFISPITATTATKKPSLFSERQLNAIFLLWQKLQHLLSE